MDKLQDRGCYSCKNFTLISIVGYNGIIQSFLFNVPIPNHNIVDPEGEICHQVKPYSLCYTPFWPLTFKFIINISLPLLYSYLFSFIQQKNNNALANHGE